MKFYTAIDVNKLSAGNFNYQKPDDDDIEIQTKRLLNLVI